MADVQIDDGKFTRIANVLLEKVSGAKLNGCQNAIILVIWRYTYGFKRKEHELSSGFIATATGYNKRQIEREITKLLERNIIFQKVVNGVSRTLSFNKDYESWITPGELADGESADGQKADGEFTDAPPANKPTVTPGELADQERKSFKENLKDINASTVTPESEIEQHFIMKRNRGFGVTVHDLKEIRDMVAYGITADFAKEVMDKSFSSFVPKHPKDEIRTFSFVSPRIYQEWHIKLEKQKAGEKIEKFEGRAQGIRSGQDQKKSGVEESGSKVSRGKWDDVDIPMPKMSG